MAIPDGERLATLEARLNAHDDQWKRVVGYMDAAALRGEAIAERLVKIETTLAQVASQVDGGHRGAIGAAGVGAGGVLGGAITWLTSWLRSGG